jgi:hypothetical protein
MKSPSATYAAAYREEQARNGLCRECTRPARIRKFRNGTERQLKTCAHHAHADAVRAAEKRAAKKGQP